MSIPARRPHTSSRALAVFPVEEAFEVEGDVGETDPDLGPLDADGPDKQTHPMLLSGEDVLNG